jgi:hypothetical protein
MSASIIQFYMTLRNGVKVYHWNTKSYPRHKATDEFVDNIDKLTDKFVEVYMGKYGRDAAMGKTMHLTLPGFTDKSMVTFFEEARTWLTNSLPKLINEKDTDLLNIRDEILAEVNQTLYLFTLN